jgi:hypothetical protein
MNVGWEFLPESIPFLSHMGGVMRCHPVSVRVNRVVNDDEECCTPVDRTTRQGRPDSLLQMLQIPIARNDLGVLSVTAC